MLNWQYAQSVGLGPDWEKQQSILIEMEYLPTLSVNRYKTAKGIVRREVKDWIDQLSSAILLHISLGLVTLKLPLTVRINGIFKDKRSMPDLHNLTKVICDGIEIGTGLNDRDYVVDCGEPEVGIQPRIIIEIRSAK